MDKILIVIGCEFIVFVFIAANIQNFFNKMHLSHYFITIFAQKYEI